jgi:BA14K-like protein
LICLIESDSAPSAGHIPARKFEARSFGNMAVFRGLILFAIMACCSTAAFATPKEYCEAYARDFADRVAKAGEVWEARKSSALADCLFQFQRPTAEVTKPIERKIPKPAPKAAVAQAKPKKTAEPAIAADEPASVAEELPEPAVIVAPDIEPPARKAPAAAGIDAPKKSKTLFAKLFPGKAGQGESAAPAERGRLTPGSAAWLDYCENKYASFDRETGTYKSYKGVERKCLVTD